MADEWDELLSTTKDGTTEDPYRKTPPQEQHVAADVDHPNKALDRQHFDHQQQLDQQQQEQQQEEEPYYMPPSKLPSRSNLLKNSTRRLSRKQIQCAITDIKRFVEQRLEHDLNLIKHTEPLAFLTGTGVNDDLDGTTSKSSVKFLVPNEDIPRGVVDVDVEVKAQVEVKTHDDDDDERKDSNPPKKGYPMECEVVQSLAKWKRLMLQRLDCQVGEGLYCDSTSIRKGYKGDVTHSVIADQWDFEIRIDKEQRTLSKLKEFVETIYRIIVDTETMILEKYPGILSYDGCDDDDDETDPWNLKEPKSSWRLPKQIHFMTSEELYDEFPGMEWSVHERETAAVRKYGAIFIIGMGWPLKDGSIPPEEVRSPSYDDWNLNGT